MKTVAQRQVFCALKASSGIIVCLATLLSGCGGNGNQPSAPEPNPVTLAALTAVTTALQSGATATFTLPSGAGKPAASSVSISMAPTTSAGSAYSLTVSSVGDGPSGTFLLNTTIPTLSITSPTQYSFTASGVASAPFSTSPALVATVQPSVALQAIAPTTGQAGTTLDVSLTGISTGWTSATTASFGAGVSVGGATPGSAGPVTVTSGTSATAHLVISPSATSGTRDVAVTTGTQVVSLLSAFTITPAAPLPNIAGPYTGTAGTALTFSAAGSSDPGGLALTYAWSFGDGGTGSGVGPSHTYAVAGTYTVSLVVTNSAGISSTATTKATISAAAQPPIANAGGPYTGTAGTAVAFNAAASSDPKNETLTYAWSFGDGGTSSAVSPSHTYAASGTFNVSLTVTNTDKLSATANTTATIAAAPQPPLANAGGPYTGTAGTAISFNGSGSSDPKNEALTYAWSFGDGGTSTAASPTHTYSASGTFTVALTVTNTDKLTSTANTTATIAAAPQSPIANAGGPYTGTAGTAISFNGSGSSDPKSEALTYAWSFGDGGTSTAPSPTHTYAASGTFTVSLTVTNTDKLSSTANTTATVSAAPQAPLANAGGPYTGTAGTAISFSGAGSSDPKSEALTYAWIFGDGGTSTGASPTHTYATSGTFNISLTVTNTDKLSSTANTTATIAAAPQPPVASTGGPYSGTAGTAIAYNGTASSDPKGETLTFLWSFGDGTSGGGATPTHTYSSSGTYNVSLTVTNTDSLSASATTTATVAAAPQPPTAKAGGPYTGVAGTAVTFSGAGSSDPNNETLSYTWNFGDGSSGAGVSPTHVYATSGTYTVTLSVTNTDKVSATANTTATIASAPEAPTVSSGGPYSGTAGVEISLTATGSDPKNETLTYAWNFGDGGTGSGATVKHTFATAGSFTVSVVATNTDNLSASATTTATIAPAPQAPVANAGGPYSGTAGAPITFSGTGSTDPKNETLTYSWNFGDSSSGTGATPTHTYAAAGTYTATLTVTNTDALTSSATASVAVAAAAQAPVASAGGPYSGTVGVVVNFNGTGSTDPQGQTLSYSWDFGDGSTGTGVSPTHAYAAQGTFTVVLTVTNTSGLTATVSTKAAIAAPAAQPPVASPGGPYSGTIGQAVTFNGAASSDPKNETLTYLWNFGDGATGTSVAPTHTYVAGGNFTVSLTVTNTDGSSASATTTAAITGIAILSPIVTAGGPYTGYTATPIIFDATGSYDPNNASAATSGVSFMWDFGDGSSATGSQPVHTYAQPGTYTVTLTGTSAGGTATATASATVAAGNVPTAGAPTAIATGPSSGSLNTPVSFDGSKSSDPNGLALTYVWAFGDGTSSTDASPTHNFIIPGTFSVRLIVSNGATLAYATTQITIAAPANAGAVLANAGGPYSVAVNQVVRLDGSKTANPNGHVLTYTWDFGDGTTATGVSPTHIYTSTGTVQVSLNVLDGTSATSNATSSVTVTGPPPESITANAGGPYSNTAGLAFVLDGSGTIDNLNNPLTYSWDFGDGATGSGITPTHTYATAGTFTVKLTATSGAVSASTTTQVAIAQSIAVTVTSPIANTLFGANATATVTGTVSGSGLTVTVNGTPAQVSGSSFTATGVTLREGVNLLTATATDGKGGVGTGSVSVNMDATAPTVSITMPSANAVLTTTQTAVAGLINDIVTGTIGSNDVTVTVNGQPAQVSNRSYMLSAVPLVPGTNTIKVVATDKVGNTSTTTESVNVLPATAQLSLRAISGDGQTAAVQTLLSQPLVVQLLSSAGAPIAGRPVTFTVSRSDGMVEAMPTIAQSVSVISDTNGRASILFQLGSRSGLGVNQVTASTPGAAGVVTFTASSTIAAASQIEIVRGDAQRGLLGAALPEAFQAIVLDAYGNPVSGATVQFTSQMGDGTLDHSTVTSDSNGKVSATLTLGQQEGINNYLVQANVTGNTGSPLTFHASGYAPGPVANTSVSGVVLDNSGMPVMNATVTLANTGLSTTSDATGKFLITGAPVGTVTLTVDGSTSTSTHTFPFLSFVLIDLPGQNNSLTKPVYLPFIDVDDAQTVGGPDPVTLTIAGVPGVAFTIPANSVTFPDGSKVGKMSLSQVKSDLVPMLPANGTSPNLVWTLQPAGARFSSPVQVTLPNTQGLPPGKTSEFYQYDHDLEQFVSAGTMHVSADGSVMVSDAGFGITKAGWGHGPVVPNPTTCVVSVQSTTCETVFSGNCGTTINYNDGAKCGDEPTDQCHQRGTCAKGACTARWKPDTAPCKGPLFCSDYECQSAVCVGTPVADQDIPQDPSAYAPALQIESSFTKFAGKLTDFFAKYGGGAEFVPNFMAPTLGEKSICCEKLQQKGLLRETMTLSGGITVQSPEFTVFIGTVPLGITFPPPIGTQGLTLQVKGGLNGVVMYEKDQCAHPDGCYSGGPSVTVGVEGKLRFGVELFNVYGTIGGSITGTVLAGCGRVTGTVTWSGVELKGGVQVGRIAFPYPAATLIGPYSIFFREDLTTGTVTYGVQ